MPKSRALAVRLPLETWNNLKDEAGRMGMTLSALARTKLMLASEFEGPIQECIDEFSKRLGVSQHEFLEAIVIDFMARLMSRRRSRSPGRHHFLPQFVYTDHGRLRGKPLFDHMLSLYAKEEQRSESVSDTVQPGRERGSERGERYQIDQAPVEDGTGTIDRDAREEAESHEDETPAPSITERARIDQAMFDRIMEHYRNRSDTDQSPDGEPGS